MLEKRYIKVKLKYVISAMVPIYTRDGGVNSIWPRGSVKSERIIPELSLIK